VSVMSWGDPSPFGFLVLLGCLSGFVSGLLGVGGGTVLVPALIAGLPVLGVDGPELPKIAMATSLALVVPTAVASAQTHASKGAVDWSLLGLLCPSIVAGSFVAGVFAKGLSTQLLCALFVGFAIHAAWSLLQRRGAPPAQGSQAGSRPGLIRITATGALGGAFASLLGLGVAFFAVPVMTRFIALPRAIGTAAACASRWRWRVWRATCSAAHRQNAATAVPVISICRRSPRSASPPSLPRRWALASPMSCRSS